MLRALSEWLDGRPATDALLARYLGVLFDRGRAPPSAVHLVAAVHYAAKECAGAGLRSTDPVGPATKERLERFHREGAERGTGQVRGISWKEAKAMCRCAEAPGDPAGKRDAAIISVMSDALLRVAEVSALNVDDVTFLPDGVSTGVKLPKSAEVKIPTWGCRQRPHGGAGGDAAIGVGWPLVRRQGRWGWSF